MQPSGIIYYHDWDYTPRTTPRVSPLPRNRSAKRNASKTPQATWAKTLGIGMIALALGGLTGPLTPRIRLEAKYAMLRVQRAWPAQQIAAQKKLTQAIAAIQTWIPAGSPRLASETTQKPAVPAAFDPLKTPEGASIDPVNKDFSLIVPKVGINAGIIPAVNPTKPGEYLAALEKGIAHSSLSYFPDEDGTVYLFSHSTNYDWFVGDLNAVFYLLKNLEVRDTILIYYKGTAYRYEITGKQVVKPTEVSYLAPQAGAKRLILQTCWPPGSVTERLLIFADLVEEHNEAI
jgi:LPXTG-site transpeptidase (sortase) family protein